MTQKRKPWTKWYFRDWRAEPRLKLVSRAARSFWLDLLGYMDEAEPRGFLLIEGISPSPAQIANLVGDSESLVRKWLDELRLAGVPSYVGAPMPDDVAALLPDGLPAATMLSRRMVRDTAKAVVDAVNGKRGGNPLVAQNGLTGGLTPPVNPEVGDPVKPKRRRGLKPRGQSPETRKPPNPPSGPVNPPAQHPGWAAWQASAVAMFGARFCDFMLFPCPLAETAAGEMALEAPGKAHATRLKAESDRLSALLGKPVKILVRP